MESADLVISVLTNQLFGGFFFLVGSIFFHVEIYRFEPRHRKLQLHEERFNYVSSVLTNNYTVLIGFIMFISKWISQLHSTIILDASLHLTRCFYMKLEVFIWKSLTYQLTLSPNNLIKAEIHELVISRVTRSTSSSQWIRFHSHAINRFNCAITHLFTTSNKSVNGREYDFMFQWCRRVINQVYCN